MNLPRSVILLILFIVATALGCTPTMESECQQSADCPSAMFCKLGECTDLDHPSGDGMLAVDDSDAGLDDAADIDDGPPHPCPEAPGASADNLVLNEFMANVPSGPEGDANEDGERHYHDDEFVELVNVSDETIDITGVDILNDTDVRFTFGQTCLEPLHAAVVFGGIEDGAQPPQGDGFTSFVSDTWFRYAMSGGRVVIDDADGQTITDVTYDSHSDGALNLDPELHGSDYIHHTDISDDEALFSPGTCADGKPFTTGCTEDGDDSDSNGVKQAPED